MRLPAPIRVLRQTLIAVWDGWLALLIINFGWLMCMVTIILAPPAILALYAAAGSLADGRTPDLRDFIRLIPYYFWAGWRWLLINLAVLAIASYGLYFYGKLGDPGFLLQTIALLIVIGWLAVQFYALPYLILQPDRRLIARVDRRLIIAWRSGLYTLLASPLYTLVVMLIAALIALFDAALVLPLFLGGGTLFALFGTYAVRNRLEAFQIRRAR